MGWLKRLRLGKESINGLEDKVVDSLEQGVASGTTIKDLLDMYDGGSEETTYVPLPMPGSIDLPPDLIKGLKQGFAPGITIEDLVMDVGERPLRTALDTGLGRFGQGKLRQGGRKKVGGDILIGGQGGESIEKTPDAQQQPQPISYSSVGEFLGKHKGAFWKYLGLAATTAATIAWWQVADDYAISLAEKASYLKGALTHAAYFTGRYILARANYRVANNVFNRKKREYADGVIAKFNDNEDRRCYEVYWDGDHIADYVHEKGKEDPEFFLIDYGSKKKGPKRIKVTKGRKRKINYSSVENLLNSLDECKEEVGKDGYIRFFIEDEKEREKTFAGEKWYKRLAAGVAEAATKGVSIASIGDLVSAIGYQIAAKPVSWLPWIGEGGGEILADISLKAGNVTKGLGALEAGYEIFQDKIKIPEKYKGKLTETWNKLQERGYSKAIRRGGLFGTAMGFAGVGFDASIGLGLLAGSTGLGDIKGRNKRRAIAWGTRIAGTLLLYNALIQYVAR